MRRPTPKPSSRRSPAFCRRYVYVSGLDRMWDRQTRTLLMVHAVVRMHADEVPADGPSMEALLLGGPDSVDKVDGLTYLPGAPEIVTEDGGRKLNRWRAHELTATPSRSNAWPFRRHVARLVDDDPVATAFVLDYYAHLIQHPARKIRSALLISGLPGTGKSMLAEMLTELVGRDNAINVAPDILSGSFTDWIAAVSLVVVDELVSDHKRVTAARLKHWITDDWLLVNGKNIPAYKCRNRAHFVLLTNELDAAIVDPVDRRFFVWRSERLPMHRLYHVRLARWFRNGGAARVLHFLLTRDISRFDPDAPPPATQSRTELISESRTAEETYLANAYDASEAPFACDLIVANHVLDYLLATRRLRVAPKQLARFLERIGAKQLGQRRIGGSKPRVWAIRNVERWTKESEASIAAAYVLPGDTPAAANRESSAAQPMRRSEQSAPQPVRMVPRLR